MRQKYTLTLKSFDWKAIWIDMSTFGTITRTELTCPSLGFGLQNSPLLDFGVKPNPNPNLLLEN